MDEIFLRQQERLRGPLGRALLADLMHRRQADLLELLRQAEPMASLTSYMLGSLDAAEHLAASSLAASPGLDSVELMQLQLEELSPELEELDLNSFPAGMDESDRLAMWRWMGLWSCWARFPSPRTGNC